MISVIRKDFNTTLASLTNLDAVNAQGGVVAWTLPPAQHRAFNPIPFVGDVFYAVTASKPAPSGKIPNFARVDKAGGSTGITFDYPVASTVAITVELEGSVEPTARYTVAAGSRETERIPYYADIVSISPSYDSQYMYLAMGESYDGGDYLVTSAGTVFYKDTESIEPITLSILPNNSYEALSTLQAEPFKGQAVIDVGAVVRTLFARQLAPIGNGLSDDPALGVAYSVTSNTPLGTFLAVNAVAQVGESADMSNAPTPLTLNTTLYRYEGYELTASVISGSAVTRVGLNTSDAGSLITIEDRCVPPAPFYVRWINALGGVDYWMFCKVQEYAPQVSSSSLYEQSNIDPAQATTNRRAYAIATKNGITVGAQGVAPEAWEALQRLPFAPLIEWWNEKLGKWIGLTVAKYDSAVYTNHSTHDIEIEFELPAINTQF